MASGAGAQEVQSHRFYLIVSRCVLCTLMARLVPNQTLPWLLFLELDAQFCSAIVPLRLCISRKLSSLTNKQAFFALSAIHDVSFTLDFFQ